ncbi:MAG: zinc ribbon domain-containing protein [Propionibacteriaceae bacterium]|jgi:putative FmdB family regulatory protein|uniref:Putative regulatory protein FmdB zinc ribbon domain-containing protein n=1 Tax=Brooklawnia propionicigenes TaxID=3041175 RepID=A0AAN0MGS1_9ACTN|nr:FmdB family zinc ribbon protein [Brooklawnia sp. SH051]MCB0884931.1 zinc ribbon domain-containing protein [Propionibacteriaceae bacterium]MEA5121686.1 FmdB family zinc ribbon protein [Propionibacterium sp.]NLI84809.1 zinc ribbon domain-containing protein [Propionibacterium sp.]BEH02413.1 hypothetical protein brsh051_16940 [Brooklawnia sp. SH051]
MPTYQYRCQACHNDLEAFQKFTDDPLTICPDCGGSLRKVFNAVGIVFKGSGFYATDSRKASSVASPASSNSPTPVAAESSTSSAAAASSSSGSTAKDSAAA